MDDNGSSTPPPQAESSRSISGSSAGTPPQLPPSEAESSRSIGGSTGTPPQLPPSEAESRSVDGSSTSTPPQLPPSEAESRRIMGGSSTSTPPPPNFLNQQPLLSQTVVRSEAGTIQPPANLNLLQEVELMQRPPLGLDLNRTPELLAEIQAELDVSKFPVTSISIGPTWRRESRREDDLTLKLYFTMKKLVWEFVEGPLKKKIEVSWSDITAIQARVPDDQPTGLLRIQLGNTPSFFREAPPRPMRFTDWEPTSDFTVVGDHALYHRIHEAEFRRGILHELYTALLLSDRRLIELTMYPFPAYPTSTQGDQSAPSSSTAAVAGLPSTTVINPFTAVGVGERSPHRQMQGESSSNAGHHNQSLPEENIAANEAAPINGLSTLEGSNGDAGDQQR